MFCYNLILFHRQIAMIVGQIPCRHKFFDQRVTTFNPSAETTYRVLAGSTSGEVHHGKFGKSLDSSHFTFKF